MRLHDTIHGAAPVDSLTDQRRRLGPPVPRPDVGTRFGRPSAFTFSNERRYQTGSDGSGDGSGGGTGADEDSPPATISVDYPEREPPEYMRIIEAEAKVLAELVEIPSAVDPEKKVEVDRLRRMLWHYTEFPPKPDPWSPQPTFTTYYDLEFALHPVEAPASE